MTARAGVSRPGEIACLIVAAMRVLASAIVVVAPRCGSGSTTVAVSLLVRKLPMFWP